MFVQVMEGRVNDVEGLRAQIDEWRTELAPGATGFLGTTAGVTADGGFIAVVRFESEGRPGPTATGPSRASGGRRPAANFDGDVTFTDCPEVDTFGAGGSDDAGFVQVIKGRGDRAARARRRRDWTTSSGAPAPTSSAASWRGRATARSSRPCTSRSEAEARANEKAEPATDEEREAWERMSSLMQMERFIDICRTPGSTAPDGGPRRPVHPGGRAVRPPGGGDRRPVAATRRPTPSGTSGRWSTTSSPRTCGRRRCSTGMTIAEVGDRFDGDQLGDDPEAAWAAAAAGLGRRRGRRRRPRPDGARLLRRHLRPGVRVAADLRPPDPRVGPGPGHRRSTRRSTPSWSTSPTTSSAPRSTAGAAPACSGRWSRCRPAPAARTSCSASPAASRKPHSAAIWYTRPTKSCRDSLGAPPGTRTLNPQIKSLLLCQIELEALARNILAAGRPLG